MPDSEQIEIHGPYVRALMRKLAGEVDPTALELLRLIRMVDNELEAIAGERLRASELNGPRLRLLMRMLAEETFGDAALGTSPTHLSRCQHVSKNTISALLRGLEEQGLIERALDPRDRRVFRVRVSDAGRELVESTAPAHVAYITELLADLSAEEQAQLGRLLSKLHGSLLKHSRPDESSPEGVTTAGGS